MSSDYRDAAFCSCCWSVSCWYIFFFLFFLSLFKTVISCFVLIELKRFSFYSDPRVVHVLFFFLAWMITLISFTIFSIFFLLASFGDLNFILYFIAFSSMSVSLLSALFSSLFKSLFSLLIHLFLSSFFSSF